MLLVLLSWIYILLVCLIAGSAVFALLERLFPLSHDHSLAGIATAGMVALTVYAEYYSLFDGIGMLCHLLMLAVLALCLWRSTRVRQMLCEKCRIVWELMHSYTGLFVVCLVVIGAFYTSRGSFHTDTGIYHAAAIRWNEEYGVVKGLANLDLHYGYNSAYLVFCSLFTFSWIPGVGALAAGSGTLALHTTTGFLAALYGGYACRRLRLILTHRVHLADAARLALLIYILTNATGMMSPATDYGTLMVCSYLICAWLDVFENADAIRVRHLRRSADVLPSCSGEASAEPTADAPCAESTAGVGIDARNIPQSHIYEYGLLSMLALFATSMKLSSAGLFLLVLLPLVTLIRQHNWRPILRFVAIGTILFLPFVIRNVILSGWLFYPFEAIDLFDVAWKVPYEYSKVDSDQIKVWGRCLYDVAKVDLPITEWIGTWWNGQSDYGQLLLIGVALSPVLFCIDMRLARGKGDGSRPGAGAQVLILALYVSVGLWFLTAPFIRYGLSFLLALVYLPVFACYDLAIRPNRNGLAKIVGILISTGIIVLMGAWTSHYAEDDLVFIKHHLTDPYYLTQQPFDTRDEETYTMENADGSAAVTIYEAGYDEVNSYYAFPGTCYPSMAERTMLLGDSIEDGFAAK